MVETAAGEQVAQKTCTFVDVLLVVVVDVDDEQLQEEQEELLSAGRNCGRMLNLTDRLAPRKPILARTAMIPVAAQSVRAHLAQCPGKDDRASTLTFCISDFPGCMRSGFSLCGTYWSPDRN